MTRRKLKKWIKKARKKWWQSSMLMAVAVGHVCVMCAQFRSTPSAPPFDLSSASETSYLWLILMDTYSGYPNALSSPRKTCWKKPQVLQSRVRTQTNLKILLRVPTSITRNRTVSIPDARNGFLWSWSRRRVCLGALDPINEMHSSSWHWLLI